MPSPHSRQNQPQVRSPFTDWGFRVSSSGALPVVTVPAEINIQNAQALGDALMAANADHPTVRRVSALSDASHIRRSFMIVMKVVTEQEGGQKGGPCGRPCGRQALLQYTMEI